MADILKKYYNHPDYDPTGERAPVYDEKIRQVIEAYKKMNVAYDDAAVKR